MDIYQGEIFSLYNAKKKPLKEILELLRERGVEVTPKLLYAQLRKWQYRKYFKSDQVREIMDEKSRRELLGKESTFSLEGRPVDLEKVSRHHRRAGMKTFDAAAEPTSAEVLNRIACRTPPPSLSHSLPVCQYWVATEKLHYDVDVLVKGSFEGDIYIFNGNDSLIHSSEQGHFEKHILHTFLGHLGNGKIAADRQDFISAGSFWQQAFLNVEALVRGQYHDIIPNLIQQVNDLIRQGRTDLAVLLKNHIAACAQRFPPSCGTSAAIFTGLRGLEIEQMAGVEDRMMQQYRKAFEFYLGRYCYNAFVMETNAARRILFRDDWATFADHIRALDELDTTFGLSDRRTLDIVSLRMEVLFHRGLYESTVREAMKLVQRADLIQGDPWQQNYNLTRGWFYCGHAQFLSERYDDAARSFANALRFDGELRRIEGIDIFSAERTMMLKCLDEMGLADGDLANNGPLGAREQPVIQEI